MKENLIRFFSILFYGINISHIYLIVKLLQYDYIACFVWYAVLFILDKAITTWLMFKRFGCSLSNAIYIVLDCLQLGFIYFCFKRLDFSFNGIISTKLFGRVYPLLIFDVIFFFALRILEDNSKIPNELINLAYTNFVILVFYSGILNYFVLELYYKNKDLIFSVMHQVAHYCSVSQAFLLKDSFGINLAIFYLAILLFNLICVSCKNIENRKIKIYLNASFQYCVNNYYFESGLNLQQNNEENKFLITLGYLNFLIELGLLLGYYFGFNNNEGQNNILLINMVCAICSISYILVTQFNLFFKVSFTQKQIWISTEKQMQQAISCLYKDHKFMKHYLIMNYLRYTHDKEENQNQQCLFYEIHKAISFNLKKGIKVEFLVQQSEECTCKLKQLAIEEEHIHYSALECIKTKIVPQYGANIFFSRYNNGFLFSYATAEILCRMRINNHNQQKTEMLRIICFDKYIKSFMIINPSNILYEMID